MKAALAALSLGVAACSERAPGESDPHDPAARIRAILEDADAPVLPALGDTVHLSPSTVAFYRSRGYAPAWTDRSGFLARGEAALRALRNARAEGLEPAVHHERAIVAVAERVLHDHEQGFPVGDLLGSLDLLLTEAFLRYATDLSRGTVDPESAGLPWLIPRQDSADQRVIAELLEASDPEAGLARLHPATPYYRHLRAALPRYRRIVAEGGWPSVDEGEPLALGSLSPRVLQVRARLTAEGDPVEAALAARGTPPELYDPALASAVAHFQERHGIDADGEVGAETREQMNVPAEERLLQLELNLDRWRWLPRDLGERYVLVNVAGFDLSVVERDRPVLRMAVVVGKEGWNTPFFQDTIEYVVTNPYWNVPPSIVRRDIVPALQRDPGYLARNGFEVVSRSGRRVNPSGVDVSSGGYTVRQRPGRNNALGQVKFVFPNSMNIYLHDTPARHLFERTRRMYSSGCIRIEKPRELAEYLLSTVNSEPPGTYDRLLSATGEQWARLEKKVPIYILYFTAWAEGDGSVAFYPDVYGRDDAVGQVARARLAALPLAEPPGEVPSARETSSR